ncbi:hypothetical protein AMTRI_Chr08g209910 [Amborella trichopoda]
MVETPATKHFVLIHGACHGAWCWYKMASLLKSAGYKVSAVDLGGAGINMGNADSISTFEEYNRPAIDIISGIPENEKVILVGHSIGGFSLTHAIYKFGKKKISLVVYVAAAPANFRGSGPGFNPDIYIYNFGNGSHQPPTSLIFRPEKQREMLYALSSYEDSTLASMVMRWAPVSAFADASLDKEIERVTTLYVKTDKDQMMSQERHEEFIHFLSPEEVLEVEADHSPFFSATVELFSFLNKAAATYCSDELPKK